MLQHTQLLTTKLAVPPLPPTLVKRPRLVERLHQGVSRRLTLLSAPAGFGKTTLLSEWHTSPLRKRYRLAWVSLDEADNDPACFWSYVIGSLDMLHPGLGNDAMSLLHSSPPVTIESVLVTLLNALSGICACSAEHYEIALVLDDYHVIQAEPIHRAITFLLDYLPGHVHLLIATRVEPPLSLARFRTRGQLSELRTSEFRFTRDEAELFLNQAMKLDLSEKDAFELEARTEGWIAGLQLAALSIRSQPDTPQILEGFAGSHHYFSGFFIEEVLKRQVKEVQDFLLQTSVLQRLSAELCDAVTGREGSQAMLERIETSNLFLIPLDAERRWYRYHTLFGNALRRYLRHEHAAEFVQGLHRLAAGWYAHHGFFPDAIEHAFMGADMEWALPGSTEAASAWAAECGLSVQDTPEACREREYLTFIRFLLRGGQLQGVQELLERLQQNAQVGGRKGRVVEIIILQALAYQAQSQTMQALVLLQQALALAEPEDYIRLFVDEGTAMDTLLSKLMGMRRQRKLSLQEQFSWMYVKRLLTELSQGKRQSFKQSREEVSYVQMEHRVIQLLSKREEEILRRIAHGLSNQAIADEMVIELSTVKSHLKHIYRKLNVESRTQAVALARKLDLL